MLKLNRKVEYGLIAMKHMVGKPMGDLTSVREICDLYGTPFDPVAHVMRLLNTGGLVKSEQGAHGGYRLMENVMMVSFQEFIQLIEGYPLAFTDCLRIEDLRCAINDKCNIVGPMTHFHNRMKEFLESISLGDLLEERVPSPFLPIQGEGTTYV